MHFTIRVRITHNSTCKLFALHIHTKFLHKKKIEERQTGLQTNAKVVIDRQTDI